MTFMATPYITRADDGTLTLTWPEEYGPTTEISREVLFDIVESLNHYNELKRSMEEE